LAFLDFFFLSLDSRNLAREAVSFDWNVRSERTREGGREEGRRGGGGRPGGKGKERGRRSAFLLMSSKSLVGMVER